MVSIKPKNIPRNIDISNTLCAVFKAQSQYYKNYKCTPAWTTFPNVSLHPWERHHHFKGVNCSLKAGSGFLFKKTKASQRTNNPRGSFI